MSSDHRKRAALPLPFASCLVPRACRILAAPKRIALNPYFATISEGVERRGWRVEDFTYLRGLLGRFDILHLHFPSSPFSNRRLWITAGRLLIYVSIVALSGARGKRVVWTVHNLASHEGYHHALEKMFMNWFAGRVDLAVHLGELGRAAAMERFPRLRAKAAVVIPHSHYGEPPPGGPDRTEAARTLGLEENATFLLFFGQIRPYKNVPELIRIFSRIQDKDLRLLIVGRASSDQMEKEVREIATDERVLLRLGTIPDDELRRYIAAATLVVLPYREILNSGAAVMGLTYACPLLIPDRGAMAELRLRVGADWARLFAPPLTTGQLEDAIAWARTPRNGRPDLTYFEPAAVVQAHLDAFAQLLALKIAPGHPSGHPPLP